MMYQSLKYIICIIGLIVIMPILFIVSLFIFFEDGLPIIYKQARLGIHKKEFIIYKLRTMKNEAPQIATHEVSSKYFLFVGKFIRKTKLDEFPQLYNIIIGDLNFVGPRPGIASIKKLVEERDKNNIYTLTPGITGLAQILGFDMSDPVKLAEIDKIYLENQSMKLNLIILLGTFFKSPKKYLVRKYGIKLNV